MDFRRAPPITIGLSAVNPNGTISGLDRSFSPSTLPTFSGRTCRRRALGQRRAAWRGESGRSGDELSVRIRAGRLRVVHLHGPTRRSSASGRRSAREKHQSHWPRSRDDVPLPGGRGKSDRDLPQARIIRSRHFRSRRSSKTHVPMHMCDSRRARLSCWIVVRTSWCRRGMPVDMTSSRHSCRARSRSRVIRKWGRKPRSSDAVHDGAIPGSGKPANHGRDTYIASRGPDGWSTRYVGIPSDNPYSKGSLRPACWKLTRGWTPLPMEAKESATRASATDSTNIPLRLPDGSLVEGMAGSQSPGIANPAGHVGRYLSADGDHVVFGTTAKLEPAGNENGDVTIYERDLEGGSSEVVSTLPGGETMTGSGIGELDVFEQRLKGDRRARDLDRFRLETNTGTCTSTWRVRRTRSTLRRERPPAPSSRV